MRWLRHEMRLLLRVRTALAALLLLATLSGLAVFAGLQGTAAQHANIVRIDQLNNREVASLSKGYAGGGDAGYAAYYTFYTTWDAPSNAAFLALGLRDVAPYVLRIRALGLYAQRYEGELFNPELALPGKFDLAFVLVYLVPLFIIVLLHDIVSAERQSGRLRLLLTMAGTGGVLWYRRIGLRMGLVLLCVLLPVFVGAVVAHLAITMVAQVVLIVLAYVFFWAGVCLLVTALGWRSSTNAMALMGSWVVLTLVLPTLVNVVMMRTIPVNQGVDLMLAQRQAIHGAWDVSREDTMAQFFKRYPAWQDTAPLPNRFHWKWYYAFQQLGDDRVAAQARAYEDGLLQRDAWTRRLGLVLPGVGTQVVLHRLANTDLQAQLDYQQRIGELHHAMRNFYYPYLFHDVPFDVADFAKRPRFSPVKQEGSSMPWHLTALLALGMAVFFAGLLAIVRRQGR